MLNEERVKYMTKMAVFDQRDGKRCKPMIQYFRKDYVGKEMMKSFITGTMAFFFIVLMWAFFSAEGILESINSLDIRMFLLAGVIKYAVFMAGYFLVTYVAYNIQYTKGRQKVKKYYACLKKVDHSYNREERIKMP